ncbi:SpoIIE family protein phosphatase [Streptomyces sp. NPDC059477]|uniref:SpoIIE family protein phosphatase n=1 Tax=Streptomyces sp. NPDC059477 TaxID=3346847 RepID=UPI0036744855
MTGSAEDPHGTPDRLAALLTEVAAEAAGAVGARVVGLYLRSADRDILRLAALSGVPGPLFRPWWQVHTHRPVPIADTFRLGVQVVLPNATETMRRYPQFAAALPFPFGVISVPVPGAEEVCGALTALLPPMSDATGLLVPRDRLTRLAEELGERLRGLAGAGTAVVWDAEPLSARPPTRGPADARTGRFTWDPESGAVTVDDGARALLALPSEPPPETEAALVSAFSAADARRLAALLRDAAQGKPPADPLPIRLAGGPLRLVDLWPPDGSRLVHGVVINAGSVADQAADRLPQGVFCVDRQGVIGYVNPRAEQLLGVDRTRLTGRCLWDAVPWLADPACEDHLRAALLSPDPVHFHVERPGGAGVHEGDRHPPTPHGHEGDRHRSAPDGYGGRRRPSTPHADERDRHPSTPHHDEHDRHASTPHTPGSEPAAADSPADEHEPHPSALPAHAGDRAASAPRRYEGDRLAISVYPGPDLLTCTVVPSNRVADSPAGPPDESFADPVGVPVPGVPLYRPIVLAIALTEAVTARQVSAVVMQELLPAFGGRRLAIYLLQDRHLFLAWEAGFPEGFLDQFDGVDLDERLPGVETLTTGRPMFFDSMPELADAYPGIPIDATEGARAFLPLIASGRRVGSCILGFDRERRFSTEERTVLTALAGLIAHAMEKAQRYETEAALARGLQRALLPRRLPAHPAVETAGRYLPGTQGMDVGGDWYDVVEAGDGVALVIGDVQGHGVQAAATMGQLRSAVRAFALDDRPPDEVLGGTNRLLIDLDPGQFASCCYVRLDPATGRARIASAGHPPPLLRAPDGRTHRLDTPAGVVLGVIKGARYPVAEVSMEPGAILALYTDGLVERPGLDIDDGIGALRTALARGGAPTARPGARWLAAVADRLTAATRHTADRPDDIALLLAARRTDDRDTDAARTDSRGTDTRATEDRRTDDRPRT